MFIQDLSELFGLKEAMATKPTTNWKLIFYINKTPAIFKERSRKDWKIRTHSLTDMNHFSIFKIDVDH